MAGTRIYWKTNPSRIGQNIRTRANRAGDAVFAVAQNGASKGESAMKSGAPWNDQTTNARQGLTGTAVRQGRNSQIQLYHTMDYGIYLELGTYKMAPRAIVLPTMQQIEGEVVADAAEAVSRIMGG
jgi:HK97 gp10 family phage protein